MSNQKPPPPPPPPMRFVKDHGKDLPKSPPPPPPPKNDSRGTGFNSLMPFAHWAETNVKI